MLNLMNIGHAPLTNWGLGHIVFHDNWTMLDIGCGGGATLKRLLKRSNGGKVYGIDISEESVAKARKVNAELLGKQIFVEHGTALQLPYEDNQFDLVTAVETIYFWSDLQKCLQEVRRVLKSHCQFVIMIEVLDRNSIWTDMVDGMTGYTPEQLKNILDDMGFIHTELYRMKPSYATIIGTNP